MNETNGEGYQPSEKEIADAESRITFKDNFAGGRMREADQKLLKKVVTGEAMILNGVSDTTVHNPYNLHDDYHPEDVDGDVIREAFIKISPENLQDTDKFNEMIRQIAETMLSHNMYGTMPLKTRDYKGNFERLDTGSRFLRLFKTENTRISDICFNAEDPKHAAFILTAEDSGIDSSFKVNEAVHTVTIEDFNGQKVAKVNILTYGANEWRNKSGNQLVGKERIAAPETNDFYRISLDKIEDGTLSYTIKLKQGAEEEHKTYKYPDHILNV
jgi:hypothetical protein